MMIFRTQESADAWAMVSSHAAGIREALNEGLSVNQIARRFKFKSASTLARWLKAEGLDQQAARNGQNRRLGGPTLDEITRSAVRAMSSHLLHRHGATRIAKKLQVLNGTLRAWSRGEVYPSPAKLERLKELYLMDTGVEL